MNSSTTTKLPLTAGQIARIVSGTVEGDESVQVTGLSALETAGPGDLTFAADEKWAAKLSQSKAAVAIVGDQPPSAAITLIRVGDVQEAMATLLGALGGDEDLPPAGIHPTAVIDTSADVAANVAAGPHVVVGRNAKIGEGTTLCAGVFVGSGVRIGRECILHEGVIVKAGCTIGDRVRIGPNSVIGADGFGYYFRHGEHRKFPHIGTVVIEDDVEIGACSCVDRAKFATTRIGRGSKIDNLVQIGHNVQIGAGSLLAALAGVAGSATLGEYVVLGGHAGIRDNISLGRGVKVGACTCVATDVPDGQTVFGIPAGPAPRQLRMQTAFKKLPEMLKRLRALETKVEELASTEDD